MRFGIHLFMVDPREHLELARAADAAGWDNIAVPDAPFFPETTSAPYPYTPDGARFWPLDTPVLDPWIAITAMAVVTKRVRFMPSVLRLSIRKPLLEAKMLSSVAAVADDRVALGVGLAWMPEEFAWLHEEMKTRGARVDEAIQIIRLVLGGGMVEFHGKHYEFERLRMDPVPAKRIPIYVGGTTAPAIRRAARYGDGWLGIIHSLGDIARDIAELTRLRREFGREREPFDILVQCPEAHSLDDIRRLEDMGVTDLQFTPWAPPGIHGEIGVSAMRLQPSLAEKCDALKRFGEETIAKLR